jgi:hypothetical protein
MIEDHLGKFSSIKLLLILKCQPTVITLVLTGFARTNAAVTKVTFSDLPETSSVRDDQEMQQLIILFKLSPPTPQNYWRMNNAI